MVKVNGIKMTNKEYSIMCDVAVKSGCSFEDTYFALHDMGYVEKSDNAPTDIDELAYIVSEYYYDEKEQRYCSWYYELGLDKKKKN